MNWFICRKDIVERKNFLWCLFLVERKRRTMLDKKMFLKAVRTMQSYEQSIAEKEEVERKILLTIHGEVKSSLEEIADLMDQCLEENLFCSLPSYEISINDFKKHKRKERKLL